MAKTKKSFDYKDPFPKRFRKLIEKKGATLDELAAEFKTTRQTVSNWQNGATVPDAISICEIARYFDVTTDYGTDKLNVIRNHHENDYRYYRIVG